MKDTFKAKLNGTKPTTKQVKCRKFVSKELNRELALHEHIDYKSRSTVSDVITGLSMFELPKAVKSVSEADIAEGLDKFLKHFTVEATLAELAKFEENENGSNEKNR